MSLRRCFSTLGCPELSLDAALALAEKHEVFAIEVRALGGTIDLPAWFATHHGLPFQLAARLRESRAGIVALDASLRLTAATADAREQLGALAAWADAAGVAWLRVFDGDGGADDRAFTAAGETLAWWRALRSEHRWKCDIMVETHDSLFTADAITRFRAAFPGTAILWDAHHTWRKGGEDPVATWNSIRPAVVHVHVKDSISVPGPRHPFTYVLPGDGEFPIAPLRDALRRDQFEGPVSLEWEKLWHPNLPPLDDALAAAAARKWW
ncbi:MAG: sugar phosphate isomerase/epimerase family protein [Opitutaceae bacterium]